MARVRVARFLLMGPTAPFKKEDPPLVVALDCHASLTREFLAGTTGCDIWEVSCGRMSLPTPRPLTGARDLPCTRLLHG